MFGAVFICFYSRAVVQSSESMLEPDEKSIIFMVVDALLTKKKFKDFFQKNVATL